MSAELAALLAGLFGVPALLLWLGHRLPRRRRRVRAAFWGALVGHTLALGPTLVVAMLPPAYWTDGYLWRGVLGFGSLLGAAVIGAGVGAMLGGAPPSATNSD